MTERLPLTMFTDWLASGERGISSEAIVSHLTGQRVGRYRLRDDHPYDVGDLNRCVKLLDQHPVAKLVFPEMASRSSEWAALVEIWDELVALLREELKGCMGRAPRTYVRMREVLDRVRDG